jgi:hypothetical protein
MESTVPDMTCVVALAGFAAVDAFAGSVVLVCARPMDAVSRMAVPITASLFPIFIDFSCFAF